VCGHPLPGEDLDAAVRRRARDELGVEVSDVRLVLPGFRYRAAMGHLVENEVCPVLVARAASDELHLDPEEVDAAAWVPWAQFADEVLEGRRAVSPWCAEQVPLLRELGPDPRTWAAASRADLPPAARLGAAVEAV
jgi:isopentenyl-diphosphate delta-isomerase type 1